MKESHRDDEQLILAVMEAQRRFWRSWSLPVVALYLLLGIAALFSFSPIALNLFDSLILHHR